MAISSGSSGKVSSYCLSISSWMVSTLILRLSSSASGFMNSSPRSITALASAPSRMNIFLFWTNSSSNCRYMLPLLRDYAFTLFFLAQLVPFMQSFRHLMSLGPISSFAGTSAFQGDQSSKSSMYSSASSAGGLLLPAREISSMSSSTSSSSSNSPQLMPLDFLGSGFLLAAFFFASCYLRSRYSYSLRMRYSCSRCFFSYNSRCYRNFLSLQAFYQRSLRYLSQRYFFSRSTFSFLSRYSRYLRYFSSLYLRSLSSLYLRYFSSRYLRQRYSFSFMSLYSRSRRYFYSRSRFSLSQRSLFYLSTLSFLYFYSFYLRYLSSIYLRSLSSLSRLSFSSRYFRYFSSRSFFYFSTFCFYYCSLRNFQSFSRVALSSSALRSLSLRSFSVRTRYSYLRRSSASRYLRSDSLWFRSSASFVSRSFFSFSAFAFSSCFRRSSAYFCSRSRCSFSRLSLSSSRLRYSAQRISRSFLSLSERNRSSSLRFCSASRYYFSRFSLSSSVFRYFSRLTLSSSSCLRRQLRPASFRLFSSSSRSRIFFFSSSLRFCSSRLRSSSSCLLRVNSSRLARSSSSFLDSYCYFCRRSYSSFRVFSSRLRYSSAFLSISERSFSSLRCLSFSSRSQRACCILSSSFRRRYSTFALSASLRSRYSQARCSRSRRRSSSRPRSRSGKELTGIGLVTTPQRADSSKSNWEAIRSLREGESLLEQLSTKSPILISTAVPKSLMQSLRFRITLSSRDSTFSRNVETSCRNFSRLVRQKTFSSRPTSILYFSLKLPRMMSRQQGVFFKAANSLLSPSASPDSSRAQLSPQQSGMSLSSRPNAFPSYLPTRTRSLLSKASTRRDRLGWTRLSPSRRASRTFPSRRSRFPEKGLHRFCTVSQSCGRNPLSRTRSSARSDGCSFLLTAYSTSCQRRRNLPATATGSPFRKWKNSSRTYSRMAISSSQSRSGKPAKYFSFSRDCNPSSLPLNCLRSCWRSTCASRSLRCVGSPRWTRRESCWKYFSTLSAALRVRECSRWECCGLLRMAVVKCVRKALKHPSMLRTSSTFLGSYSRRKVSIDSLPAAGPQASRSQYLGKMLRKAS